MIFVSLFSFFVVFSCLFIIIILTVLFPFFGESDNVYLVFLSFFFCHVFDENSRGTRKKKRKDIVVDENFYSGLFT